MLRKYWMVLMVGLVLSNNIYAQEALKDSIAANTFLNEARSLFSSDRSASLSKALSGLEIAEKINNKTLQCNLNNLIGVLYSYQTKYELSLNYYAKALAFANDLKSQDLIAKVYGNIGLNYMQQGNYLKAIEESIKGERILEKSGNLVGIGNIYANVSNCYYNVKMVDKALQYCDSALKYFILNNQQTGIANIYNTYGVIYADQKNNKKALEFYLKSIKIKEQTNDINGQANALNNMGFLYKNLKDYDKAEASFSRAEQLYKQIGDIKGLAGVVSNKAVLKAAKNDTSALADSKKAYEFAKKNANLEQQSDIAFNVSLNFKNRDDYKNSLLYYKIYDSLKDKVLNATISKQINTLEAQYQNEKKQYQIETLNKQAQIQKLELNNQKLAVARKNILLVVIIVVAIMGLLLGYSFYRRYKLQQQAKLQQEILNQQDLATKAVLAAEETERKRIATDLHDGVGQLMSAAKMNLSAIESDLNFTSITQKQAYDKAMALVDEGCKEVRAVSHNMMPNALLRAGLASAVREFLDNLNSNVIKINLYTDGLNERIDSNTEIILYRVIQECVNNVVKHAKASLLDISIVKESNSISVTIEDNGVGFNKALLKNDSGIGLKNIETRMAFLKGSVEWESQLGKGTLVVLHANC